MEEYVDAIEDGKIVRVSSSYAKKEGLMVLRKQVVPVVSENKPVEKPAQDMVRRKKPMFEIDKFRRPLNYKDNNILGDLIPNFHWEISVARKARNMTRRQLANFIGTTEEEVKMIENGVLPREDYVLINKIQSFFGINLRRDGKNFEEPARKRVVRNYWDVISKDKDEKKESNENILGDEIELEFDKEN